MRRGTTLEQRGTGSRQSRRARRGCEGQRMRESRRRGFAVPASTAFAAALALSACASVPGGAGMVAEDWPTANRDPGALRYSPLSQITPANVAGLQTAWVYHMKPAGVQAAATSAADRQQA